MRLPVSFLLMLSLLVLSPPGYAADPVRARQGMVVSNDLIASRVGVEVLRQGGNAVDAAIAVGLALAVTYPAAGNVGGGGFMLIRLADGATTFIDFREKAPASATRDMYRTVRNPEAIRSDYQGQQMRMALSESIVGWRAPGVPGTVRGLEMASRNYGKLPWKQVVTPAVLLARDGFEVHFNLAESLKNSTRLLGRFPETKRVFLRDENFYQPGETFQQPDLAAVLQRVADQGSKGFYEGETARLIAKAMQENGGEITLEDLKNYHAVERKPLETTYNGHHIFTAPPPSSGGVGIVQMLGMLEGSGYQEGGFNAASTWHYVAEVMRRYYADRSEYLADPDFYAVPLERLLDKRYLAARRATIARDKASTSEEILPGKAAGYESMETTHYSVVDAAGNAVAVTYTLNGSYGSGVTVPGTGILLNNEMDDFATKPGEPNMFGLVQGEANKVEPGKRPLSSMTPTIVTKDGKLRMVVGSPGGGRIINAVFQAILNVVDFQMNAQDAVDAPRIHHQWQPDKLYVQEGVSPDTRVLLKAMGHDVTPSSYIGRLQAIVVREDGWLEGGSNSIPHGGAVGY
ncbi:MAG: gamma-glutamyltransferase [Bryobacterales bacterium]|nr:gamma-glutamyltransferase [Bryobacterales bacterium]